MQVNVRTIDDAVRRRTLDAIERIVNAEAQASGAPLPPTIDHTGHFPALTNDPVATARTYAALVDLLGNGAVVDPGIVTGSEDVGVLALAAGAPCVFWFLGGADPQAFAGASTEAELKEAMRSVPSNHSPHYAPVPAPTLTIGVRALVAATRAWLPGT